ncbi:hypothetical protein BAE44_0025663 [Dichanthelium oligosanthes]|uniref:Uncharacterized protein n=1 Tax=Dichanthelium oligosanthes TaxID=888268 RepID=A0A1E5UKD0_9POAL|nr:hypothetical protein BAE44_0025663 [Dichanthelium oligosanthes]
MAARAGIVICMFVLIVGAALAATPAGARVVPPAGYAAPGIDVAGRGRRGGIRRGRWNVESLEDDRKREVPGGPDPQHHN